MADGHALVLFSGGQDSTACLAWALERFSHVETLGFDFAQRHGVELAQRQVVLDRLATKFPSWADRLGDDHLLTLSEISMLGETALTHEVAIEMTDAGLPSTFVPRRNLLFFTYAAALAYRKNIRTLVGGMCETDYSGYPDCRADTIKALEKTLSLGMDSDFRLLTPLMYLDKAATWDLIHQLGSDALVDLVIEHTHTCYIGNRDRRHAWGYGCAECPACRLRRAGFERWQTNRATSKVRHDD